MGTITKKDLAQAVAESTVGTHVEYQRMGLGRALLMEGFRRMAAYGATRSFMNSSNEFYQKVGFQETSYSYYPWIKYFPV